MKVSWIPMVRSIGLTLLLVTSLAGCKQDEGDVCQIDDDCAEGLNCNAGTMRCQRPGQGAIDAAPRSDGGADAAPEDASPDAAAPADAAPDANNSDAGPDAGDPDAGDPDASV